MESWIKSDKEMLTFFGIDIDKNILTDKSAATKVC